MDTMKKDKLIGIALTLIGAIFWGSSGTSVQFLEINQHINTNWLLPVRIICAGIISVLYLILTRRKDAFIVFKSLKDTIQLTIFGIFGISLAQYSYFQSIIYSDAGIATVMTYLAPILIILYYLFFKRIIPTLPEAISVIISFTGAAIIALQGQLSFEMFNSNLLFWGTINAISVGVYTLQSADLIKKYGTFYIIGWGLFIGGAVSLLIWEPLSPLATINTLTFVNIGVMVFLGTILAFTLYLEGVSRLGAVKGSILSSVEPISAALISWVTLNTTYSNSDMLGFSLIITTVFILAFAKGNKVEPIEMESIEPIEESLAID